MSYLIVLVLGSRFIQTLSAGESADDKRQKVVVSYIAVSSDQWFMYFYGLRTVVILLTIHFFYRVI